MKHLMISLSMSLLTSSNLSEPKYVEMAFFISAHKSALRAKLKSKSAHVLPFENLEGVMKTLRLRISSDTSTALGSEHFDKWDTVSRMPLKLNKIIGIAGVLVGALLNPKFIKILKTNHFLVISSTSRTGLFCFLLLCCLGRTCVDAAKECETSCSCTCSCSCSSCIHHCRMLKKSSLVARCLELRPFI